VKITKSKLNQIIKEEIEQLARGRSNISLSRGQAQNIRQAQDRAQKIIKFLFSPDPDNVNQAFAILDALEDQQLIDTIASHFILRSDGRIAIRRFKIPNETLGMILNYFAEKSDRVKNMLAQIESLNITDNFITNVDFLRFCTNLITLNLERCKSLQNVDGLEGCTNLMRLNLYVCRSLENVNGLVGCTNLNWFKLYGCESLQNVDGLQGLMNLTTLHLRECRSLQNVDGLKGCANLTDLALSGCSSLESVDGLQGLTNLTRLDLRWSSSLPVGLQELFESNEYGTAYEKFMKVLNESKGDQP